MKKASLTFLKLGVAAAIAICLSVGSASAQVVKGTFTLPYEVRWGRAVLQPGQYAVTIDSIHGPALVTTRTGQGVALLMSPLLDKAMKDQPSALLITQTEREHVVRTLNWRQGDIAFVYKPFTKADRKLVGKIDVTEALPILMAQK